MTETESPVPGAYVPGPGELGALRYMNEIEPSTARPNEHLIARETVPWMYDVFAWNRREGLWLPWRGVSMRDRASVIRLLADEVPWSDVTLLEEPFLFEEYGHPDPASVDGLISDEGRTVLCREGAPGPGGRWVKAQLGASRPAVPLSDGDRFEMPLLKQRFLDAARVEAKQPLGPNAHHPRQPPVMVRHGLVAREILPKDHWGIAGRPDLQARQIDRELAITAAARAEEERARNAGEWLRPPSDVYFEIGVRMQKEWAAQDAAAAREVALAA